MADKSLPDPLIPFIDPYTQKNVGAPFNVQVNQNQVVWVDVYIPKGIPSGKYTGCIV
jgi:hypothetical protein